MRKTGFLIYLLSFTLTIIGLGACQKIQPQSMPSPLASPWITPTLPPSQPGKATLIGRVVSGITNAPLQKVPVRLARIYREGSEAIYVLDAAFSPSGITNEGGYFSIGGVEPGDYVIVVGNPEGLYEIISEPSGQVRVWHLMPDQLLDAGIIYVKISPP